MQLPSISIIIPNFNGENTIEATFRSLLEQSYPNLQLIVMDGGSTDASVDIIKRYSPHLDYWESQKDRGQSHAINKGFARCTGDIVNWLCSDDTLKPNALHLVGQTFAERPDVDVVWAKCQSIFTDGRPSHVWGGPESQLILMPASTPVVQPSCFYRRSCLDRTGPLDEKLNFAMDFELWNYFLSKNRKWLFLDKVLSTYLVAPDTKTSAGGTRFAEELHLVYSRYSKEWIPLSWWYRRLRWPLQKRRFYGKPGTVTSLAAFCDRTTAFFLKLAYGSQKVASVNWRFTME